MSEKDLMREPVEQPVELTESELENVSGGHGLGKLVLRNNIAYVSQTNVAFGSFNNQSNTAVVIQG